METGTKIILYGKAKLLFMFFKSGGKYHVYCRWLYRNNHTGIKTTGRRKGFNLKAVYLKLVKKAHSRSDREPFNQTVSGGQRVGGCSGDNHKYLDKEVILTCLDLCVDIVDNVKDSFKFDIRIDPEPSNYKSCLSGSSRVLAYDYQGNLVGSSENGNILSIHSSKDLTFEIYSFEDGYVEFSVYRYSRKERKFTTVHFKDIEKFRVRS